jgi:putative oxidoreductase
VIVAVNMIVAVSLSHTSDLVRLTRGGGWGVELQALYLFGAVAVALLGAGRYSLSRGRGRFD